jgi:hypothetical protein
MTALGRESGTGTIKYEDENFENINYQAEMSLGKTFKKEFSVFATVKYNYLKVTQSAPGRTLSPDGIDQYMAIGPGIRLIHAT